MYTNMMDDDLDGINKNRIEIMNSLTEEPKTKPELAQILPVSRSTVDRAINELLNKELIEKMEAKYQTTEPGMILIDNYEEYLSNLGDIRITTPVIKSLPIGTLIPEFIYGSSVITVDPKKPSIPIKKTHDIIQSSDEFRGTVPVLYSRFFEFFSSMVLDKKLDLELIFDDSLYEELSSSRHTLLTKYEREGNANILTANVPDSNSIWIAENNKITYAGLTVYNQGRMEGTIYNTSDRAVQWAEEQYQQYKKTTLTHRCST